MDITTLSAKQVSELTETQIASLTEAQLKLLSMVQCMAFTTKQKSYMNVDQLNALIRN